MYLPTDNRDLIRGIFLSLLVVLVASCDVLSTNEPELEIPLAEREMPENFDYSTKKPVDIDVSTKGIPGVKLNFFAVENDGQETKLFSGITNQNGKFRKQLNLAATLDKLIIRNDYIGLVHEVTVPILGGEVVCDYRHLASANEIENTMNALGKATLTYKVGYLGSYDTQNGVPDYLVDPSDNVSQEFLNDVNTSLPNGAPVPVAHPEYLAEGNEINTRLVEDADIWVTFVHEGAGYRNVLGFYTYASDNPPSSVADIDSVTIIFPNVSYQGGGGGLYSGDKVYLGYYPAGTEIGWVLLANGWQNGGVTGGVRQLYSNPEFNPESNPDKQQHNVLLYDAARDLAILGFEDLNREGNTDDDFNDALFYVTSNPRTAIVNDDQATVTYTGNDSDGDGVNDPVDDYPDDPSRAYDNFYPGENTFGSLAFEDLWPARGDYDFNDLVVDYYFTEVLNAANQIVELKADFILRATGASYENGFGFELDLLPDLITSVTGSELSGSLISVADNGVEANQDRAVCIVFDNAYAIMQRPQGYYVNTQADAPKITPDTTSMEIIFTRPVTSAELGNPPYNPFIYVNQNRIREVHLPGYAPTSLAEGSAYFDTQDDNSTGSGFYKTANNLPWALDIVESLAYPQERVTIDLAHNYFISWAENSGQLYSDWFKDKPGYRVTENIYD